MHKKDVGYFQVFHEVARAVLSVSSVQVVLHLICKRIVSALHAKASALMLIDEETGRLETAASHLLSQEYLSKGPLDAQKSISAALKGEPVLVENAANDRRIQYRAMAKREGIASILSVPMVLKEKVVGVLRLYTARPRRFSENELELISAIAEIGALATENASLFESKGSKLSRLLEKGGVKYDHTPPTEKYRVKAVSLGKMASDKSYHYFGALHRLTLSIAGHVEMKTVLVNLVKEIAGTMQVKGCSLLWLKTLTKELELVATYGLSQTYLTKGPLKIDRSIPEVLKGKIAFIANVSKDPRIQYPKAAREEGIVSILSVPISVKEKVRGVLRLYSDRPTVYKSDEIEFAKALAEIGGIAILNAKLHQARDNEISFWLSTLNYLGVVDREEGSDSTPS